MPAATGSARAPSADGEREVRLIVARASAEHVYRLAFIATPSEARKLNLELRRTTYSLRRLSDAEARAIKPLRLRLHRVQSGDTVAALAARFPFERFQREWFRVLNDLSLGDALVPGSQVKLVTG
ncbi:MAG: hypothetical protein VW338_05960 [Rhodospirillaceae bacterium]